MDTSGDVPKWNLQDRLAKALRHSGTTKEEMAAFIGVNTNTIGNYLAGRTHISHAAIVLWAMRTGVDAGWLEHDGPEYDDEEGHPDMLTQWASWLRPVAV